MTVPRYNFCDLLPAKTLTKMATAIGLCLGISPLLYAQLPAPVEAALNRAHISTDDISLVIMPVTATADNNTTTSTKTVKSRLPAVVPLNLVQKVKAEQPDLVDADELPPELESTASPSKIAAQKLQTQPAQSNPAEKKTAPASSTASQNKSSAPAHNNPALTQGLVDTPAHELASNESASDALAAVNPSTVDDNQPLAYPLRHLSELPRTPASTMKLIPTFIALDLLGPNFVWVTQAYHTGFISANTLYGDLIIKGSGDPKLTLQRLNKLLEQVKQAGIQHIKGDIVLDSSVFQGVTKDPAAFDNDPLRPYNASPDGLLVNFSTLELTAVPLLNDAQRGTAKLYYKPLMADYDLPTTLPTASLGNCSSARSSLAPIWQAQGLKFNKSLPTSCGARTFYIAYPDAKDFAKRVVKGQWLSLGNTLSGSIKFLGLGNTVAGDMINTETPLKTSAGTYLDMSSSTDKNAVLAQSASVLPASPLPFVRYPSLPLSQQIFDINHYSNNVMTEQLTLTLPLFSDPSAAPDTTGHAIKPQKDSYSNYTKALGTINQWWQKNLTTPAPVMSNGSGLCRDCSVTAENLADLLQFAYNHRYFDTYVNSLGVAGISGTITEHAERLPSSAAIGRAWIKTGTLNNVTSMAGYVHGKSGQDYIVVGIINGSTNQAPLNTYEARYVLDTMLDWTAKH